MKTISLRVPDWIYSEMKKLDVNWSEKIRQALEKNIRSEKMRKACEVQDKLRKKASGQWSGTQEVRKWRDRR